MNDRAPQPDARTPDEHAMLAFVEGDLTALEETIFRRSLRHAPQVLARLEAMRRDKALLRASMLRETLVPSTLAARIDDAVGREALLAAANPSSRDAYPDIVEPALTTRIITNPWRIGRTAGLAMAAALAIAATGAILILNRAPAGRNQQPPTDLAMADRAANSPAADPAASALAAAPAEALAPSPTDPPVSPSPDPTTTIAASSADPIALPLEEPVIDIPEPTIATRLLPGSVARRDLMALAEQHRLALRVSAEEPRHVIAALEAAADTDSGWRIRTDAPATLASSLGVTISPFDETNFAGTPPLGGSGPGSTPPAAPQPPAVPDDAWLLRPTEDAMAVYLAEVDMTEEGLATLDRDLRRAGPSQSGFAELADPLPRVLGERAMLIPAGDVIWWYHPPREWSRRTLVPVVIERR